MAMYRSSKPAARGRDLYSEIQKKTFTKWFNAYLKKGEPPSEITDLYQDLTDGTKLLSIMAVLCPDDVIPKGSKMVKMRIQKVENLNKVLDFLTRTKGIKLENIGGVDIEAGHPDLTLGLIWTIILRLQIGEVEGADSKNAKLALLLWCQAKTKGYANVNVTNFTSSWKDGLAFNALIHNHRSNMINFDSLTADDPIGNLNNAFNVADQIGIDRLLDAEDVADFPDEKSIMTQLFMYYNFFAAKNDEDVIKQRLNGFLKFEIDIKQAKALYDKTAADLMKWIEVKTRELSVRDFPNNVEMVKPLLLGFKNDYQQKEKPPRFVQKSELETQLFDIQTQLRAKNRVIYIPTHGVQAVRTAWDTLEISENEYAVALREALKRLERLDKLAEKFLKKAALRDSWMDETARLLSNDDFGSDLSTVQDSKKRENAITTEVNAYSERLQSVLTLGDVLVKENYFLKSHIEDKCGGLDEKWEWTNARLDERSSLLTQSLRLQRVMSDLQSSMDWVDTISTALVADVVHKSVGDVEELLESLRSDEASADGYKTTSMELITQGLAQLEASGHPDVAIVTETIKVLNEAFAGVSNNLVKRRERLQDALEFRQFESRVKEEDAWIRDRVPEASSTQLGNNISSVTRLKQKSHALQADIVLHQSSAIQPLANKGKELLATDSHFSDKIMQYMDWLSKLWTTLQAHIAKRNEALDNAFLYQGFRADSNEAESFLTEQEKQVTEAEYGKDTLASQNLLRFHKVLTRDVKTFEKTVIDLNERSLAVKHLGAGTSGATVVSDSPIGKQAVAKAKFAATRDRELSVDVGEVLTVVNIKGKWWKMRSVAGDAEGYVPASFVTMLEDDDVVAQATTTDSDSDDFNLAEAARTRATSISDRYKKLVVLCDERKNTLEETIAYYDFGFEADELDLWLEEKHKAVSIAEPGKDYEQNEQLTKMFEIFKSDIEAYSSRISRFNDLAVLLVTQSHAESESVRKRQDAINLKWQQLQDRIETHNTALSNATVLTQFSHSVEETCGWMQSKLGIMSTDVGHDVASVSNLQRLHEVHLSDVDHIKQQVDDLTVSSQTLSVSFPEESAMLAASDDRLTNTWDDFNTKMTDRKLQLFDSLNLQKFLADGRDFTAWANSMQSNIDAILMPVDVMAADGALKLLSAYRSDMVHPVRNSLYMKFVDNAQALVAGAHYATDQITESLAVIQAQQIDLSLLWERHNKDVCECRDLRAWESELTALSLWLEKQETFLSMVQLGDTLEEVEGLVERHSEFMNIAQVYTSRFKQHSEFATKITAFGDADNVVSELNEGIEKMKNSKAESSGRFEALLNTAREREAQLQESHQLQTWLRQSDGTTSWINEQMVIALEPTYNDASMLPASTQRHDTFTQMLHDFTAEVESLRTVAASLVTANHYAASDIDANLTNVDNLWAKLNETSTDKQQKLKEALQEWDFKNRIKDVNMFCEDVTSFLKSNELGKDTSSAQDLLQRCERRNDEVVNRRLDIDELSQLANAMVDAGHFRAADIVETKDATVLLYNELLQPMAQRLQELQESFEFQNLLSAVQEAHLWIAEHLTLATSKDFANDVRGAARMLKEQLVLNDQIVGYHDQLKAGPLGVASRLIEASHYASADITSKVEVLSADFEALRAASQNRLVFLKDMDRTAKFFSDVTDATDVIDEQNNKMLSQDKGADEVGTSQAISEHKDVISDVEGHRAIVEKLATKSKVLLNDRHEECESQPVIEQMDCLNEDFTDLEQTVTKQSAALEDFLRWHRFANNTHAASEWVATQIETALSGDIGNDNEECEMLREQFNTFMQQIDGSKTKRRDELMSIGSTLSEDVAARALDLDHIEPDDLEMILVDVGARSQELTTIWLALEDAIKNRDELLAGAHEIHTFYSNAEKANNRIADKSVKAVREDYGKALITVEALLREHSIFETDVDALGKDVTLLRNECQRLCDKFPEKADSEEGLTARLIQVDAGWDSLQHQTVARKQHLVQSHAYHKFDVAFAQVFEWIDDTTKLIREQIPSDELDQAETLLRDHKKLRAEIDTRNPDIQTLYATGTELCTTYQDLSEKVTGMTFNLKDMSEALENSWHEWQTRFEHSFENLEYERDFLQETASLKTAEAQLEVLLVDDSILELTVDQIEERIALMTTLKRTIAANTEKMQRLQSLTKGERLELEKTGGAQAVEEYEKNVEETQHRRRSEEIEAAAKQRAAEEARKASIRVADEQRVREEADRAQRRKEQIAARALHREELRKARLTEAEELNTRITEEAQQRRSAAINSGSAAMAIMQDRRRQSNALMVAAAAKAAAVNKKKARSKSMFATATPTLTTTTINNNNNSTTTTTSSTTQSPRSSPLHQSNSSPNQHHRSSLTPLSEHTKAKNSTTITGSPLSTAAVALPTKKHHNPSPSTKGEEHHTPTPTHVTSASSAAFSPPPPSSLLPSFLSDDENSDNEDNDNGPSSTTSPPPPSLSLPGDVVTESGWK